MRTLIVIQCPDCGHGSAEFVRGLDDGEPDLAVCAGCECEWEVAQ